MRRDGDTIDTYDVYGTTLSTSHRFSVPMRKRDGPADLVFHCTDEPPTDAPWEETLMVDAQGVGADGDSVFLFAALPDRDVIRITGGLEFHLWPDRIVCHVLDGRHRYLVDIALLGMVYALWLEQRGVPVLHGSAAVVGGVGAAFLAASGAGKSSLAAACVHAGHALLTEDLLALDGTSGRPGYPMLRLWPEQAERFVGEGWAELDRARPDTAKLRVPVEALGGSLWLGPAPLGRLYLPAREARGCSIRSEPVPPQEALIALVQHSFLPREVHRWGLQPARLAAFARLTAAVPVSRLHYPSGYDVLPEVVAFVDAELASR